MKTLEEIEATLQKCKVCREACTVQIGMRGNGFAASRSLPGGCAGAVGDTPLEAAELWNRAVTGSSSEAP